MFRSRLGVVIALTLLLTLSLTSLPQPVQAQQGTAWIRVINTAPDSTGMNVYLNTALAARGLAPGVVFNYFQVPAGKQQVSFRRGSTIINNAAVTLDLAAGDYVTVVAINKLANLQALVLRDDASAVVRGQARVRAVHAVVGGPNVDVATADGSSLFTNLAYGAASEYALLNAGSYTVNVTAAGNASNVLLSVDKLQLKRERRYDIFVIGEAGGRLRAVVAEASTLKATGTNQVRFGHFVPGAGAVDLLLNAEDAFNNVRFANVTFALVLAPGTYKAEVFPAGKRDKPLISADVAVETDQSVFLAAIGTPETLELRAFPDDYKPLRVGTSRIQFVHAAPGGPEVALQLTDGSPLVPATGFGASNSVDVGAGVVNIRAVAAGGSRVLEREVRASNGTVVTVIAYDSDPAAPGVDVATYDFTVSQVVPVRFVHASAKAGAVDVYLDGERALAGWRLGASTDYIDLTPGVHSIKVFEAGADPDSATPAIDRSIEVGSFPATAVALDLAAGPTLTLFPDNLQQIGLGRARVRLIQASPEVGAVRWLNQADGTPLAAEPIGPGSASSAIDVAAGSYTFRVVSLTDTSISITFPSTELAARSFTTFVIVGPTPNDVVILNYKP